MIYTVTFNPSIDYTACVDEITLSKTNRSYDEQIFFGGKGINVSMVLKQLGVGSKALGFTAGFTGAALEGYLESIGIDFDFVRLDSGFSRINVKLKGLTETEINGSGPDIPKQKLEQLLDKLDKLQSSDVLVLAGSIPRSVDEDIYEVILKRIEGKGIRTVVDASGKLLLNSLKYKPFLIKPNLDELGGLFGVNLTDKAQAKEYALKLKQMGAQNVLVSMAGDGAVMVDENGGAYEIDAFKGSMKNSVGAGDSMVAGFLAAIESGESLDFALKLATAAGSATAFSDGLAVKEDIFALLSQLD